MESVSSFAIGLFLYVNYLTYKCLHQKASDNHVDSGDAGSWENELSQQVDYYERLLKTYCKQEEISLNEFLITEPISQNGHEDIYNFLSENIQLRISKIAQLLPNIRHESSYFFESLFLMEVTLKELDYIDSFAKNLKNYEDYWDANIYKYSLHERMYLMIQWHHHSFKVQHAFKGMRDFLDDQGDKVPNVLMEENFFVSTLVRHYLPHRYDINRRTYINSFAIHDLKECKPGLQDWRKYEDVCEDILNYCFKPQISKVYSQVRSSDGFDRRDFVLPINHNIGIYNSLFHEYNCKNIVVEVKNKNRKFTKAIINQLTAYLNKPTIGRFGICIVRDKSKGKVLRKSITRAYADSTMLILLLDDNDLIEMIYRRTVFGSIDGYLLQKKVQFELNY